MVHELCCDASLLHTAGPDASAQKNLRRSKSRGWNVHARAPPHYQRSVRRSRSTVSNCYQNNCKLMVKVTKIIYWLHMICFDGLSAMRSTGRDMRMSDVIPPCICIRIVWCHNYFWLGRVLIRLTVFEYSLPAPTVLEDSLTWPRDQDYRRPSSDRSCARMLYCIMYYIAFNHTNLTFNQSNDICPLNYLA